jgi:TRAP-type C4-dicarboxylate transport system permease small subunit
LSIAAAVARLSRLAAVIASVATLACLALVAVSVIARYAFGTPLPWADEVAGWLVVALVMLAVAEAQRRGEHIGVDPPGRIAGSRLALAFGFLGIGSVLATALVLLHEGIETVAFSRMVGIATNVDGVPAWWLHALIPLGAALLALVATAQLLTGPRRTPESDSAITTRE